ncbi:major facilitator superfamily domain-containing protein [Multifurca ochricompacta]|uniref:Major facilitator superfamily domain-containing protein n=1 Tax=Multifurca ochricompacta TaxID=376703 RepID=A0AAD4QNT0_9AGAM|nr:major facilitator superfamily domain-containing protein [Multifurca ochricompacta]
MFFWHPHSTFDFWHHHSKNKHHDSTESPSSSSVSSYEVSLEPVDNPQELSLTRRWFAVICISSTSICVTCASSMAAFAEAPIARQFHVGKEVTILGVSLFVLGLGLGPLVAGPMSEIYGRRAVYRWSFASFFVFMFPVAFAPDISVYLIFRFISGYCGAAFLSVAGGSVSDMFSNAQVATPMAVYTICPFLGPELGPILSGFINQHLHWRWTFYILIIWSFFQAVALIILVPETCIPVILKWKAQRLREITGDLNWYAPMERAEHTSIVRTLLISIINPFAFPIIFEQKHGFNIQCTGLTFLGIATGMLIGLCTMPYWNRYKDAHGSDPPPEFRLLMGQVGGVLVPLALFWLAFSTYHGEHWVVPVLASVPFGTGTYFIFTSSFTYIVIAYRPIATFALASNTAMRTSFAALSRFLPGKCIAPSARFVLYYMGPRSRERERREKELRAP